MKPVSLNLSLLNLDKFSQFALLLISDPQGLERGWCHQLGGQFETFLPRVFPAGAPVWTARESSALERDLHTANTDA